MRILVTGAAGFMVSFGCSLMWITDFDLCEKLLSLDLEPDNEDN